MTITKEMSWHLHFFPGENSDFCSASIQKITFPTEIVFGKPQPPPTQTGSKTKVLQRLKIRGGRPETGTNWLDPTWHLANL